MWLPEASKTGLHPRSRRDLCSHDNAHDSRHAPEIFIFLDLLGLEPRSAGASSMASTSVAAVSGFSIPFHHGQGSQQRTAHRG